MFQSTHPRRVRLSILISWSSPRGFNPRTHVGCDAIQFHNFRIMYSFNPRTHVGCDRFRLMICTRNIMFQSTHPRRVRLYYFKFYDYGLWFQSTHPRRVRPPKRITDKRNIMSFNPRTHVGCDRSALLIRNNTKCFNPRTHVGCDAACRSSYARDLQFQSTHPRRVRLLLSFTRGSYHRVSIHAPT